MMMMLKELRIPEQTTTIDIVSAIENSLLQLSGAVVVARRVAGHDDDEALMNMLWGVEGHVFELQAAFDALRARQRAAHSDIDRLRKVLDRVSPEALAAAGIFPLADANCGDDELRKFVDEADDVAALSEVAHG
ncbi:MULTISPECIES: hypothetical protein [unclassified Cupriavidus]|uniref:hypothetical protein n=1 Tax=unclassified Cupriavidus TaxID=2640874 RepID=UPI00313EBEA3